MVHTFKCLSKSFMLDVESGSLFQTDDLTKKLVDAKNSPDELTTGEFSRYSYEDIHTCEGEIDELMRKGVLFTQEPKHNVLNSKYIKSMCLNVSHMCNLRCTYCFADADSYLHEALNMPLDTAKKAIDFLIASSGSMKNLEVDFFGGEPLLNLDVVKKTVEYAKAEAEKVGKKFRFTITTNALALNDDAIDFFNREMYNVVVSIDGRKDVHNRLRKTANGKDSFDVILQNAINFRSKRGDKQYYIRGTFTSKNKDFALDALALNDFGFDQISLEPVVLPDGHDLALKEDDIDALCIEYERLAEEYLKRRSSGKDFNFFHFNVDLSGGPCESKRLKNCGAGCSYVAVTPTGDIYPCHQFVGNLKYKLGNVHQLEKDSVFSQHKELKDNSVLNKEECKSCWAKYFCSGGCAANSVNLRGSAFVPVKISCDLLKKRTECALAIYAIENDQ